MSESFTKRLAGINVGPVLILDFDVPLEPGQAPAVIRFQDGTNLQMFYWRLIKHRRALVSSFDHRQRYRLPAPVDAIKALRTELENTSCTAIYLDRETGDLILHLSTELTLQVFNFTSYEIWEMTFPDGTGQYSNYVLGDLADTPRK